MVKSTDAKDNSTTVISIELLIVILKMILKRAHISVECMFRDQNIEKDTNHFFVLLIYQLYPSKIRHRLFNTFPLPTRTMMAPHGWHYFLWGPQYFTPFSKAHSSNHQLCSIPSSLYTLSDVYFLSSKWIAKSLLTYTKNLLRKTTKQLTLNEWKNERINQCFYCQFFYYTFWFIHWQRQQ